jgi:hypothetical protein
MGVCPECRQESCGDLPCYIEASTTERCWDRGGRDAHLEWIEVQSPRQGIVRQEDVLQSPRQGIAREEGRSTGTRQVM